MSEVDLSKTKTPQNIWERKRMEREYLEKLNEDPKKQIEEMRKLGIIEEVDK